MANKVYEESSIQAIANAIRTKNGSSDTYTVAEMAPAILDLPSGGGGSAITTTETQDSHGGTIIEITAVDLSGDTVTASRLLSGYTAHDASGNAITGTYVPSGTSLQTKSVTPTESQQTVTPDSGYDGLSQVTVNAIDRTYVGTGVTRKSATTITPTKSSQTAVASGVYTTGAITVTAIPSAYQDVTGVTATASDVVSGKDIVDSSGTVVHGSLVIQHYYTGSSMPSSSLGVDGDIYLKTS